MKRLLQVASVMACALALQAAEPLRQGVYRGRPVWFEARDGFAIVEGDIILGSIEELTAGKTSGRLTASTIVGDTYRWPAGEIPYTFDPAMTNRQRVLDAIAHWNERTPIRLVERAEQRDYVQFTQVPSGCTANVGRIGGMQRVNLGEECTVIATIHEIGHAVGLWHTQARADRDRYVRIQYPNLDKAQWFAYDQHLYDGDDLGPYDYASVMHYGTLGFQRNYGPGIETVPPGIPIGSRPALSAGDREAVLRLYGQRPDVVTIETNPTGLPVVIDGESRTSPVQVAWADGEEHTISVPEFQTVSPTARLRFARWGDTEARERRITISPDWRTFVAHFSQEYLVRTGVTPAAGGSARILTESADGYYPAGTQLRIEAIPAAGFTFLNWQAGAGGVTALAANGQGASANPTEVGNNFNNLFYVAVFTQSPVTAITSEPPGRTITVDGTATITPRSYVWTSGSSHTVTLAASQTGPGGASRYRFANWRHGGPVAQSLTAGAAATYTALFTTQHRLSTNFIPYILTTAERPSAANIVADPPSPDGYYNQGAAVTLSATDGAGFQFANWTGDLTGRGTPQSLTMSDSMAVTATFLSPLLIWNTGVVNEATMQPAVLSPGQRIVIFSPAIGPEEDMTGAPGEDGRPPAELSGRRVLFDGEPGRILQTSRNRLLVQVPDEVAGKPRARLAVSGVEYNFPRPFGVLPADPGIYTADGSGRGQAKAWNEDGAPNNAEAPGRAGSQLRLLVNGAGPVEPPAPVGTLYAPEARLVLPVRVWIGGREAKVAETLAVLPEPAPGQVGIAVEIPGDTPAGPAITVEIEIGGRRAQAGVTIAVRGS